MLAYLFFILLVKTEAERARSLGFRPASPPMLVEQAPRVVSAVRTPSPGQMSFFSVYCGPGKDQSQTDMVVRCKVGRAINNLDQKVIIVGNVYEDVVGAAGQILIPAGSKVVGEGFCEPERGRILGRGRWTFFVSDHQISVAGALLDATRKEGLSGEENETGQDNTKIKGAIYRDGLYLYVPVGTEFGLRLTGNISVTDLGSAFDD